MLWKYWPEALFAGVLISLRCLAWGTDSSATNLSTSSYDPWTTQRKIAVRERTRQLWYHGFDNYMTFAFPLDELSPLSCTGRGPDWDNPSNIATNDVAGNFSLTLIDVLDTLVVLNDRPRFEIAVRNVIDWVNFDVNTKPQVFETTIRVLGGLLSGHIFASQTGQPFHLPWYKGELLKMAKDLGERLLPAFATPTGMPYARVNLRHGVMKGETQETCTAGAGSLILEFATLSRLTGDDRFEKAAYKAFFALWNRKSDIGLVGNTINTFSGLWSHPEITGIGAGIDSFYEYALKWYILSGEVEFLDVWKDSYAALMRYSRAIDGYWYRNVNIHSGDVSYYTIDSLSAFWPGLQVLSGDVQNAIKSHMMYWNLWRAHSGLPEVYDTNFKTATSFQYPLRPELAESTWYLYRATRDTFYLDVGERIFEDLENRAKVGCGLTGIADLRTNKRDDRMESFALSETLKYLYLLFDEENPLHSDDSNYVFTTEGHLLTLPRHLLRPVPPARLQFRQNESHQCPAYHPFVHSYPNQKKPKRGRGLTLGIRSRSDIDYSRELLALLPDSADRDASSSDGWCEQPKVETYSYDFILSADGQATPEDPLPSQLKLAAISGGYIIHNITGIRTHIVRRLDGKGYDITKLGPHAVKTGQIVYINDTALFGPKKDVEQTPLPPAPHSDGVVPLRFFVDLMDPTLRASTIDGSSELDAVMTAWTSTFGGKLVSEPGSEPIQFAHGEGVVVASEDSNLLGCNPYERDFDGAAVLVRRGECTFVEKLLHAKSAGASGVIVISDIESRLNPSADAEDLDQAGDISDVALVVLPPSSGFVVDQLLKLTESTGMGRLVVTLVPEGQPAMHDEGHIPAELPSRTQQTKKRILYLNGHPLVNTQLLN
ncbi:alpha mannosidase-like protein [Pleurotus ostreatus]|uniref:alpha-1,2-Mannosidase n=1 Tax=Pleurotus ostreatus TaxID=5322 RepID=A0A8H6ZYE0_PLEOS|nr:alpha mannosidase-like protein [Pleurotus ostreatus]KAF7433136.1 alpha mannosidase-like protein [Pleurotus ostreatus]